MVINTGNKATGCSYCFYMQIYFYMLQEEYLPSRFNIIFQQQVFPSFTKVSVDRDKTVWWLGSLRSKRS